MILIKLYVCMHLSKQTNFQARHTSGKEGGEGDSPCDDCHIVNTTSHAQTKLVKCLEVQTLSTKLTFMIQQAMQENDC